MRNMPYQMHTGSPIAGWISLACGLAALVIYVKYIRTPKRSRPSYPAGSGAALAASFRGNALPALRAMSDEATMPEPALRLAALPCVRD
jgi:hypothetical protein